MAQSGRLRNQPLLIWPLGKKLPIPGLHSHGKAIVPLRSVLFRKVERWRVAFTQDRNTSNRAVPFQKMEQPKKRCEKWSDTQCWECSLTSCWECFRSGKRITSVNIVQYWDRESIYYTSWYTHRSHGTYEVYRILIFLHSMENSMLSGYDVE